MSSFPQHGITAKKIVPEGLLIFPGAMKPATNLEAYTKVAYEIDCCIRLMHASDPIKRASADACVDALLRKIETLRIPVNPDVARSFFFETMAFKRRQAATYVAPAFTGPLDVVYIYKTSRFNDLEIRYSLRSLELYAPNVRKVWIYGDRPAFLTEDTEFIEHVPEAKIQERFGITGRVTNHFMLQYLASKIPDLAEDYLLFCDDMMLLKPYSRADALKQRYLVNLVFRECKQVERSWQVNLWHSYGVMMGLEYPVYNFAAHVPIHLTRQRVANAYTDLQRYITEHSWCGLEWTMGILNHAYKNENMPLVNLADENSRCGFWGTPPTYLDVHQQSKGKQFFNFDEYAFCEPIHDFLKMNFSEPSRYEA